MLTTSSDEFIDHSFDVKTTEYCETCEYNGDNTKIPINFNVICAHCIHCNFVKDDQYIRKDIKNETKEK